MSFSIGIVGLPNVGKSTLFKALTKKQVDAANYPFCTIDPNVGVVAVPDPRLDQLSKLNNSEKIIPTTVEFVDIAGLVKGAHSGEGLGNKFLSHIRQVDAIAQVVRSFSDKDVIHVHGEVNPSSDRETINIELAFADLATVEKRISAVEKEAKSGKKDAVILLPILNRLKDGLANGQPARDLITDAEELSLIRELNLLTAKPLFYILNVDEDKVADDGDYLAISAKIEAELAELPPEEAQEYLTSLNLSASGLDRLIRKAYDTLKLITYFTSGPQETRAWTIEQGTKAPQAAGVIHTDFEKGFIRAEIVHCDDLITNGSESAARDKGLLRLEGKDYVMKDGDVAHFRFSV